ncbi:MAG: GNAT family N-acetyltransferase [Spirochaetaceae bacterium]|nr:GNAT family N-acetyltransferase [Spirochaetaceae bacterium]
MIDFKPVGIENFWDVLDLSVTETQKEYVFDNALLLAQAKVQPECVPMAVYAQELLVGFLMYGLDQADGNYWIYHLMIDKTHQRKGYAKETFAKLLQKIQQEKKPGKILLLVNKKNVGAIALYKQFGFKCTGEQFSEHSRGGILYREFFRRQRIKQKEDLQENIMELLF